VARSSALSRLEQRVAELEAKILETRIAELDPKRREVGQVANWYGMSAGDNCTFACTSACTETCTDCCTANCGEIALDQIKRS